MSGLNGAQAAYVIEDSVPAAPQRPDIARELDIIQDKLRSPCQALESNFLRVGNDLSECSAQLQEVTNLFEVLPQKLNSEEIVGATGRLESIADKMQSMAGALSSEEHGIIRLIRLIAPAGRPIEDLAETTQTINVVAINARIASAHIGNLGDDLSVFMSDIARLSQHATTTIKSFAATYQSLMRLLKVAGDQWSRFETAHASTLGTLASGLSANLATIVKHREAAAAASIETGQYSRQIGQQIGTAVFALQIGDMTRQRVEHVEEALTSLANILSDTESENDANAAIAAICRLQAAQMEQLLADFDREASQISQSLQTLAEDAEESVHRSQGAYGGGKGSGSFLGALGAELREACGVMRTYEGACTELDKAASAVTNGVTEMLGYVDAVHRIESDLRIVSLNMSLKCRRLGDDGRALNVIAQELRELVVQTVSAAQSVASSLQDAAELAQTMGNGAGANQSQQIAALEQEAERSIALLDSVDVSLTDALTVMSRNGQSVVKGLRDARSGIDALHEASNGFRESHRRIAVLAATPVDGDAETVRAMMDKALTRLGGRYTMASERALHQRLREVPASGEAEIDIVPSPDLAPSADAEDGADLDALFL